MKIAVAGTGYVGLSISVLLAQHNDVYAVDIIPEKVAMINNKKSPIVDKEIEEYLAEKELSLTATLDAKEAYTDANGKKVYKNTDQNGNEEFTYEDGSLFTGHYSELTQKIQEYNGKDSLMEEINAKFDEMDAEMTAAEEERAADNDTAVDEPVTYPESKAVDTEKRDAEAKELGLTPSDRDGAYLKETAFGTFLYVWDPETEEFKEFPAGEEGDEECDFTTSGNVIDRTNDKAVEADARIALQEAGLNVVPGEPFIAEKDGTYYEYNKENGKFEEMKE